VRNWRALGLRFRAAFLGMKPLCFFCLLGDDADEDVVEKNWLFTCVQDRGDDGGGGKNFLRGFV